MLLFKSHIQPNLRIANYVEQIKERSGNSFLCGYSGLVYDN